MFLISRQHGGDHLNVVSEALWEQRSDRTVDQARCQDRALTRPSFPLEETAGDLPGGVHALLDVDGEREEVDPLPRLAAGGSGGQHLGAAHGGNYRPVGLQRQLAGVEGDLDAAYGASHGCFGHALQLLVWGESEPITSGHTSRGSRGGN